jgi:hypothetical protein
MARVKRLLLITGIAALSVAAAGAQTSAREQLTRGQRLWDQRLSKSAILALEAAAADPSTAAEAHETLARIYAFKGWQQDNVFPGWHDEPAYRERAIAELKAALAADPERVSARLALNVVESWAAAEAVDPAPPRAEVRALDARLEQLKGAPNAPIRDVLAAIEARAKIQGDPAPYFTGAQIMIDRGAYDQAIALATRGIAVSDRFIDENLGAYQMEGKSQGAHRRGRATGADLVGWTLVQKKAYDRAATTLEEAERLFPTPDFTNQFHLAELARLRDDAASAREHYLNALSLSGGPAPLRQKAKDSLSAIYSDSKTPPATPFDAWLEAELSRRREERKSALLKSLVDRPLPSLALKTVDGKPYDTNDLRGKVLLLNFFASW